MLSLLIERRERRRTANAQRADRDLSRTAPRLPSGSIRIVPTSRCSARTRCRSTSSSAATYQFSRGIQNGGAAPSILARGRRRRRRRRSAVRSSAGATTRTWNLIGRRRELRQLQPESARSPRVEAVPASRTTASASTSTSTTSSTATGRSRSPTRSRRSPTSQWLRPTNVLKARFFKIGGQFDF